MWNIGARIFGGHETLNFLVWAPDTLNMNELKQQMIQKAVKKHSNIFPCSSCRTFEECFTVESNNVIFWYNTEDNSTHLMVEKLL